MPHAHAQTTPGTFNKTTADKVLTYPYEAGRTGIVFHYNACNSPEQIVIQTRTDDFELVSHYVNNNQVGLRAGSGDSQTAVARANYLELVSGRNDLPDGVLIVTVKVCDQAPSAHTVTVMVWHDQGEHSDRPASSYFVRDTSASQDTGIAIHRSAAECRFTDVRLATGAPDWLELRQHRANGTADGAGGRRFTVRMEKDHANDRHVRVRFKDDASPAPGSHAFSVVMARTAASGAGCTAASAAAYTLSYTINISLGVSWDNQGQDRTSVQEYAADALGGPFAVAMGPRVHRSSSLCRWTDANLVGGGSFLGLQRYATTGNEAIGALATSVTDVRMQRGSPGDRYLGLIYRPNVSVSAGTITVSVEIKPSARCERYAGLPNPAVLRFTATINAAASSTEPWIIKTSFERSAPTISVFSPASIYTASRYREVYTGIIIGRRTATCNEYSHNLLNHRALFEVGNYYYGRDPSNHDSNLPDTSDSTRQWWDNDQGGLGLHFHPSEAKPVPNTTITLHVALGKHPACGNPTPITLSYTMSFGPAAPWGTLANDVATVTTLFRPSQLAAAASATDTGIRFNRGVATSVCTNVDVELASGNRTHLELQKYNGTTADGSAAASFSGLTMHAGATGKPVGLQFKAGVSVAAGVLTVAVLAKPASSCNHAAEPIPLTVKYELLVGERQLWQVHDIDNMGRAVQLRLDPQQSSSDVGLRVHRNLSGCDSLDVSLPSSAPAYMMLQQHGPNGPSGSLARTQTAVPMKGTGAADDRHVRLVITPSSVPQADARLTMSIEVSANATACTGSDVPAAQMASGVVVVARAEAWSTLAGDNATAPSQFLSAALRAAASATDTGLRFHRGTSVCPQVDVEVRPAAFLELRKYNGSAADGAAASALSNVRMQTGHADDRRVGVQFKAGANLPSGLFTVTVVAEPVSGCAALTAPWPLTLTYELAVLDAWPWRAAAQDNLDTLAQLNNLALQGSVPHPTGLRVHRNSQDCSSTDVALASDSPAYMKLGKYQSNGTADGAAARSLTGVNMSGSGATDRHVRVTFDGGTDLAVDTTLMVTLTVTPNSSCTGQGHPAAAQLVGTVAIVAGATWSKLAGDVDTLAQTLLFQPSQIRASNAAIDTGLRLHRGTTACPNVDVTLNTTTHLELRQYTSSAATGSAATFFNNIRMENNHANDRRVGVQFRAGATLTADRLTLTLIARANASCTNLAMVNPLTVAYELEIRENWPWRTQGQDNLGTQAQLASVVLDTTGPVPTGLRVQRDSLACQSTDVALASGSPAYMKLRKYQSNGTADGSEARSQTGVNMSGSGANDRYVEIAFDGGTKIAIDTTLQITLTVTPNSSCTGQGHPPATQVVGTVVVIEALPWQTLAGDVANRDRILFKPSQIQAGAATDTGLRFHRSTAACPDIDVTLRNTAHLELRQYTSSAATGTAAAFFRNVRMQANHANDRLVGVQFRSGANIPAGPFTLTLVAEANASCTNPAKQLPLTLAYTLSVQEDWPLRSQGQDNLGTQARLPARSLSGATGVVPTGLRLHRNIFVCSNFDVALAAGAPAYLKLGKYQANGTADGAPARSLTGVAMPGSGAADRHVRVAIDGGTSFTALTTVQVTMTLATNSSCASQSGAPASHELVGTVAVVPPDAWIELAGDVDARPDTLFRPARIRAANAAIDTGLRFHRGTDACPDVDVTLNTTTHLELRQYTSSAATGSAATFFRNVRMQANHANDRRIGVQFRAGATVQAGQLTLTLVARASSGCASQNAPSPLTLAYTLAALERWPWRTQAQDSFAAPASVHLSALATTGAVPTGLRVHRNSPACSSVDVALAAGSPSYLSLQRHSAAGVADGAAARSLAAVNMAGAGANDRHAQVMIAGGTTLTTGATVMVSLSIAPNSSCSTAEGVQARMDLVGSFLIAGRGEEEIAEESIQAGSAMAMRMMGLETLDAVLGRATAGSGAAATEQLLGMLAAKEAGLESGDIDLREFLAGQSFELAATERRNGGTAGAAAWGRAAFFKTASTVSATTELESELFSAHFGADYRWSNGIVLGMGLGRNELEGNYKDESVDGSYQLELDLYQPYAVIPLGPAGWLAAYGSQGSGEIMLPAAENNATDTMHDADYIGWGLGWRNDLDDLRMRASASSGELEAALGEMPMDSKAGVVRLGVAYAPSFEAIPVRPELEAAWSKDWGDAQVGQHWLLGLGLEYAGDGPLQARVAYQHAVAGDGDLAGLELDFRFLPGRGGLGPSFALRPGYGLATGAAVFDQVAQPFAFDGGDDDGSRRLRAEMAWGLPVSGGVLTPYSDWSVVGESDQLGAGLRLGTAAAGSWQLGWQREDSSSLRLQLRIGD